VLLELLLLAIGYYGGWDSLLNASACAQARLRAERAAAAAAAAERNVAASLQVTLAGVFVCVVVWLCVWEGGTRLRECTDAQRAGGAGCAAWRCLQAEGALEQRRGCATECLGG
jgi:hypothetical protein